MSFKRSLEYKSYASNSSLPGFYIHLISKQTSKEDMRGLTRRLLYDPKNLLIAEGFMRGQDRPNLLRATSESGTAFRDSSNATAVASELLDMFCRSRPTNIRETCKSMESASGYKAHFRQRIPLLLQAYNKSMRCMDSNTPQCRRAAIELIQRTLKLTDIKDKKMRAPNDRIWSMFATRFAFEVGLGDHEVGMLLHWKAIEQYLDPTYSIHAIGHHDLDEMEALVEFITDQCEELGITNLIEVIRWEMHDS